MAPDNFGGLLSNKADGKPNAGQQSGPHKPVVKLFRVVHLDSIQSETAANGN